MLYLPVSLFIFIFLLNFFFLPPQFYYFPSSFFNSLPLHYINLSPPPPHSFLSSPFTIFIIFPPSPSTSSFILYIYLYLFYIFFYPQIHRPPIDHTSTLHRPHIDLTSTPCRHYIDPTSTLESTFFNTAW